MSANQNIRAPHGANLLEILRREGLSPDAPCGGNGHCGKCRVIVDDTKRGMGYGQEMLRLALRYAFDMLKVERVTLGVFENNLPACRCYQAAGFKPVEMDSERWCEICGEMCRIIEMEIEKKGCEKRH